MLVKFSNDKPIFLQLAEIIKVDIISGKIKEGEKLPSVRDFALSYGVNPNTVQKSLQILEDDGLIFTDRTNGKFVSCGEELLKNEKDKAVCEELMQFIEKMNSFGVGKTEIINLINKMGE